MNEQPLAVISEKILLLEGAHFKSYIFFTSLLLGGADYARSADFCLTGPTSTLSVNIREKGAKGDGITDDTSSIQAAVDQLVGSGGTVLIPDGIYIINAITGIQLKSNITLRMSRNAVLRALPNREAHYSIINIIGASNVNLIGGILIGDRDEHLGAVGEWGMGITLRGVTNVTINGTIVKSAWGDGFYISGASKNVKFCSVIADNNRRQGMSIISVDGMVVRDSIFKNTGGAAPQAGLDLEPNEKDTVTNVEILNSQFISNIGFGLQFYTQGTGHGLIKGVTVDGNTISRNLGGGVGLYNTSGNKVINNDIKDNISYGIHLFKGARDNVVTGNRVTGKNAIGDEGGNLLLGNRLD
ncbi:right-handed parallel beta-helix repeat-containing protein [Glaciimonas sp. Gout2]|uniref:right-handed parallel beta-helix repeat-containing protein n=1 Tax=unclassified Glaciimonas TaxID=2644401 RepID=UPI002B22B8A9|nr:MULTISPECIES: right-handed parallel beta-helix repeat-containing protein [unclassified Glaciimonas]MEB0014189.1 right-handed parallel beta-helix repeat-containing protein [Glaciimonas sp. Cout2]MEB0084363.1 right-handed parallel beta-helix repeat-containing protein [Glaciimonas sp. Gout2]